MTEPRYTVEFQGAAGGWFVHDAQKIHPTAFGGNDTTIFTHEICEQLNAKDTTIAAQAAEIERLRGALNNIVSLTNVWDANKLGGVAFQRSRWMYCGKIASLALLAPAPGTAPDATSIPALSKYAAEQVAKVNKQIADEREGKK